MNRPNPANNRYHYDPRAVGGSLRAGHVMWILTVFLIALNMALVNAVFLAPDSGIQGLRVQQEQIGVVESRIGRLKRDNQRLYRKIQSLKTDAHIQERLVRQQLGWVRGNEIIVEFPPKMP